MPRINELPPEQQAKGEMAVKTDDIARVCHEAHRALCAAFGDLSQVPWEEAPEWQRDSAVKGVQLVLAVPDITAAEQHEAWVAIKRMEGWTWGPERDETKRTHPCLRPFDEFPPEQQAKDRLFRAIVRALAPLLSRPTPPLQRARADSPALGKFNLGEMSDELRRSRSRRGIAVVDVVS